MKKTYFPAVIGAGLLISGALIGGLASADIDDDKHGKGKYGGYHGAGKVAAKRLDINNDGKISLDELTARQDRRFAKLDANGNGSIDKDEFNARLTAMFSRMDTNSDGFLDEDEVSRKMKKHGKRHDHDYGSAS
jgi:hypothetical protein